MPMVPGYPMPPPVRPMPELAGCDQGTGLPESAWGQATLWHRRASATWLGGFPASVRPPLLLPPCPPCYPGSIFSTQKQGFLFPLWQACALQRFPWRSYGCPLHQQLCLSGFATQAPAPLGCKLAPKVLSKVTLFVSLKSLSLDIK